MFNFLSLLDRGWTKLLTTGQASPYCFIFWMFRKTRKANSIKTSSLFPDFRLKYCGKEVFFSQATLAINVSTFLIPSKITKTIANKIQQYKRYFSNLCIFQCIYFFRGFLGGIFFWEHILESIFWRGRGNFPGDSFFFIFFLFSIFFRKLQLKNKKQYKQEII